VDLKRLKDFSCWAIWLWILLAWSRAEGLSFRSRHSLRFSVGFAFLYLRNILTSVAKSPSFAPTFFFVLSTPTVDAAWKTSPLPHLLYLSQPTAYSPISVSPHYTQTSHQTNSPASSPTLYRVRAQQLYCRCL
jgi:hypothetical protein